MAPQLQLCSSIVARCRPPPTAAGGGAGQRPVSDMAASAADVAAYRERGWVSIEGVLAADHARELAALVAEHATEHLEMAVGTVAAAQGTSQLSARRMIGRALGGDVAALAAVKASAAAAETTMRTMHPDGVGGTLFAADDFDVAPDDAAVLIPRKINAPYDKDARYRAVVHDSRLHALASALVGKPVEIYGEQVFVKGAGIGSEKPFHQDNFYFKVVDPADVITCWIALDDASPENGCMQMSSASHLRGMVPHDDHPTKETHLVARMDDEALAAVQPAPVRAGGVVCWAGSMLHGSSENTSDMGRCAFAVHFTAVGAELLPDAPPTAFEKYHRGAPTRGQL